MKFASLGSGSSGNATLVTDDQTLILIDCGFTIKETVKRLARLGLDPESIDAIIVTHEHSDHVKGVAPLARKYKIPVFMTEGTFASRDYGQFPELHLICHYEPFAVGDIQVHPVAVPHDAREPAQFVFSKHGQRLGILTDLGSVTSHVLEAYQQCHGLLVEANHDVRMLSEGPYPLSLKRRVASAWGHLNNSQTVNLLQDLDLSQIEHLVIGHISRTNNTVDCVRREMAVFESSERDFHVHYACQDEGFDWLSLGESLSDTAGAEENSKEIPGATVIAC
ncbi:Putative metallo-hydrolase YycJ [Thalassocella blandensis]|nr:Putative metallo-hydrolase YycJ [Thalassocella blandensis]